MHWIKCGESMSHIARLQRVTDKAILRRCFQQDTALYGYALGDLEDSMWSISTFTGAFEDDNLAATSLLWTGVLPPVFLAFGEPDAAKQLIASVDASEVFFMLPESLMDVFEASFRVTKRIDLWRMVVTPRTFKKPSQKVDGLRRLTGKDVEALKKLYETGGGTEGPRTEEIDGLSAAQLDQGVFWGVEAPDGALLAVAGSHIVAPNEKVGAVGYVFTASYARGNGFAKATTAAVTSSIFDAGIETVILNVARANTPAVRAYQFLGYEIHSPIVEGPALKNM